MDKKACGKNDQRWSVTVVIVQLSYERVLHWTLLHGTSVVMIIPSEEEGFGEAKHKPFVHGLVSACF